MSDISRCICHSRLLPRSVITTAAKRPLTQTMSGFYRATHTQRICIAQYILRTVCRPQAGILSKRLNIVITTSIQCQRRVVERIVKFFCYQRSRRKSTRVTHKRSTKCTLGRINLPFPTKQHRTGTQLNLLWRLNIMWYVLYQAVTVLMILSNPNHLTLPIFVNLGSSFPSLELVELGISNLVYWLNIVSIHDKLRQKGVLWVTWPLLLS